MATCEVCGNDYSRTMTITVDGSAERTGRVFDSFECAIAAPAPSCAHCARRAGSTGVVDSASDDLSRRHTVTR